MKTARSKRNFTAIAGLLAAEVALGQDFLASPEGFLPSGTLDETFVFAKRPRSAQRDPLSQQGGAPPAEGGEEPRLRGEEKGAIFGVPLEKNPLLDFAPASSSVISGQELRRKLGATLGETLANEPGISASAYSPGTSRPVIRGFEGVRVRTLRDGLGTMDLSADSPDHGVLVDTLMTEAVEIYRGPSSLLYGNSAIGGAVNTRTRYIPGRTGREGHPFTTALIGGYESQGHGSYFSAASEARNDWAAIGFSASHRRAGDITLADQARTETYESVVQPRVFVPRVGSVAVPNPDNTLRNSDYTQQSWSVGARLGGEKGWSVGVSHHHFATDYGIPYFFPGDATDFFGDTRLDAQLDRTDLELGWKSNGDAFIREVKLRLGRGDYEHEEQFTGQGKDLGRSFVETKLEKLTHEGRFELFHGGGNFKGVIGVQAQLEDTATTRLIVPPPTPFEETADLASEALGVFAMQEWSRGSWALQAGLRWDQSEVSTTDQLGSRLEESGTTFSQSLSLSHEWLDLAPFDLFRTTLTASHIERLPTSLERYAFYNNAALGNFIIGGDLDGEALNTEVSSGLELAMRAERSDTTLDLAFFYYNFSNYVYLQDQRGISFAPTAQYVESPAEFYGIEAALTHPFWQDERGLLEGKLFGDIMRGIDTSRDSPLPRIPAARLGGAFTWESTHWSASLDARYVFAKTQVATFPAPEFPTDNYFMLNADLSWRPLDDPDALQVTLRARNILDEDAREATSFRKDTVPLAGFGFGAEVRRLF